MAMVEFAYIIIFINDGIHKIITLYIIIMHIFFSLSINFATIFSVFMGNDYLTRKKD